MSDQRPGRCCLRCKSLGGATSYFRFPADELRCQLWSQFCRGVTPTTNHRLYSVRHYTLLSKVACSTSILFIAGKVLSTYCSRSSQVCQIHTADFELWQHVMFIFWMTYFVWLIADLLVHWTGKVRCSFRFSCWLRLSSVSECRIRTSCIKFSRKFFIS